MTDTTTPDIAARRFVLPADVAFVPIVEFSEGVRASMGGEAGDVAVTRPGYRYPSRLVDDDTAALLQCFRPARSIADAIVRFCGPRSLDAHKTLVDAFDALQLFVHSDILAPEDSPGAQPLAVSWSAGQLVLGVEVVELLQHTHDSEVYRVQRPTGEAAALKIGRPVAAGRVGAAIEREAEILGGIAGEAVPRLREAGTSEGRPYLLLEWVEGVPVTVRAAQIRSGRARGWQAELHGLVSAVVRSYASLHAAGVVHGDVHGRNVFVRPDASVRLIDFGLARRPGGGPLVDHDQRGGFGWALDPQAAQALLDARLPEAVEAVDEQYAVATLVYELMTGAGYLRFSSQARRVHEQVVADVPLAFAEHGVTGWADVEAAIGRALAKQREDRFVDMEAFAAALAQASIPEDIDHDRDFDEFARARVDSFIARLAVGDRECSRLAAPVASVDQGAAGVAWLFLRVGVLRGDPNALGQADIWARRACAALGQDDALFVARDNGDGFHIDPCSVVHRAPGVHWVRAMVCLCRADFGGLAAQVEAFVATAMATTTDTAAGPANDLSLGRAGVLCAAVSLVEASRRVAPFAAAAVRRPACKLFDQLSALLDDDDPPGLLAGQPVSMAHGWVGLLHALLRATAVLDVPVSARLGERVDQVVRLVDAVFGEATGSEATGGDVPGWCNGAAGQLGLFVEAHRRLGTPAVLAAAERAAVRVCVHPDRHAHLCCGVAGRVFALLDLHRHTGNRRWLDEAHRLARQLADTPLPADASNPVHSLFWGRAGSVLAIEETRAPAWAAMPIFGAWGWPAGA